MRDGVSVSPRNKRAPTVTPERSCVTKNNRTSSRNELEPDANQRSERHHVEQRNVEHDGDVTSLWKDDVAAEGRDRKQDRSPNDGPKRGRPHRRQVLQDRLDYRPARTPRHGNSGEEGDRFTAPQRMGFHSSETERDCRATLMCGEPLVLPDTI
jgi:hypothetical protein